MTVGEKIRSIRKEHGYTQKQLAEKIGFPPQRIGQYETGVRNPRIETLLKIAHALEVPITALLDSDDEKILKTLAAGAKQVETINTEINRTLVEIQNLKAAGELEKAKELNIPVISEAAAIRMFGDVYDFDDNRDKLVADWTYEEFCEAYKVDETITEEVFEQAKTNYDSFVLFNDNEVSAEGQWHESLYILSEPEL